MIKTALTMNISPVDSQSVSFLANGTHLGLLSSAGQNIHVQTSHRPVQMVVGIKAVEPESGSRLAYQRQQINSWQAMYPLLSHRGIMSLNALLSQYHLMPHLLICLDENRLQAWIGQEYAFYLLRQGEVRLLHPVTPREADLPEPYLDQHQYYNLQLYLDDFFFILPPDLMPYFASGEFTEQLLGLRQLPAKMSDLVAIARQRGYEQETTWLALQVQRLEEEQNPDGRVSRPLHAFGSFLNRLGSSSALENNSDSATDAISADGSENESADARLHARSGRRRLPDAKIKLLALAVMVLFLALAIVSGILLLRDKPPGQEPTDTTEMTIETTEATTSETTLATTQTTEPTTTAAPEIILVVSANRVNLRAEANRDSALLAKLVNGDLLVQLEEPKDDWVKVRAGDGQVGYVFASYVALQEAPPSP